MTKKLEFDKAVDLFKFTDIDPREFVCLVKEIYQSSDKIKSFILDPHKVFLNKIITMTKRELMEQGIQIDEEKAN